MKQVIDAFWRAVAYCLHPRVIALSLLPLLLMVVLALGLGYLYWESTVAWVRSGMESVAMLGTMLAWMDSNGLGGLRAVLAPLTVVFVITPLIVVGSLLAVAALMTPAMVNLVADRRFPQLERKSGGSITAGAFSALGTTAVALVALVVSMPLWLIPPLVLILPPLIWGWLTCKVLTYDVLADHASREERQTLTQRHYKSLLGMGVMCGYLGAAPSLVWASGVVFIALAPVLVPIAIWIYTLVFAFAALWFAHFALHALQELRLERSAASSPITPTPAQPAVTPSLPGESSVGVGTALPLPPA
jgi:hypothetical protein